MNPYYRFFGLERDPFLDTADPYFYYEFGALRKAKERLSASVDASRGLIVIVGDPGTGKTSLAGALEEQLLADDRVLLGKILDPSFATDVEFLIAVGRVFGLVLPPRSSASLKNALKNFFFETAILEKRTLVLTIDEAQNMTDENLEALRLLLNYHVPQRKLLNILLFGQSELETRILRKGNLEDRVDGWIRLSRLDDAMSLAVLDFRLTRAGLAAGTPMFTPDAQARLIDAGSGLPRRLMMLAHLSMREAADRASSLINEDHVKAAMLARGITPEVKAPAQAHVIPAQPARIDGGQDVRRQRSFFARLFARR
ncbi:MAG: AAA family ATPase [Candidatus Eremiobacteraeota bacterium]|nr:AAA family ATPase [Candidatus Eremiobacteraeota bacterium]